MFRCLLRHVLVGLMLSAGAAVHAAPPPPGTVISNTASGLFNDQATGQPVGVGSNTVNATVTNSSTAALVVAVTAASNSSTPGATLALTASVSNNGGGTANPVAVSVNGAATSLFVLNFPLPANTTFASASSATAGAQTLYQVLGAAANTY